MGTNVLKLMEYCRRCQFGQKLKIKTNLNVLLNGISNICIRGRLYKWVQCCLINRKQKVCSYGTYLQTFDVKMNCLHISVMGAKFFFLFIWDIYRHLNFNSASNFADDTREINVTKIKNDCKKLQDYLDQLFNWAEGRNMNFDSNKH